MYFFWPYLIATHTHTGVVMYTMCVFHMNYTSMYYARYKLVYVPKILLYPKIDYTLFLLFFCFLNFSGYFFLSFLNWSLFLFPLYLTFLHSAQQILCQFHSLSHFFSLLSPTIHWKFCFAKFFYWFPSFNSMIFFFFNFFSQNYTHENSRTYTYM